MSTAFPNYFKIPKLLYTSGHPIGRPNPSLNSDPACIAFRSLSSSRFLGSAQRLDAGGARLASFVRRSMNLAKFLVPVATLACAIGHSEAPPVEFGHYQVILPAGFKLSKSKTKMMDFELFDLLNSNGSPVATIYLGNCPQFEFNPSLHEKRPLSSGFSLTSAKVNPEQNEFLIECTSVTMSGAQSAWQRIHVFRMSKNPHLTKTIYSAFMKIKVVKQNI